jgi:hypothetical protein
LSCALISGEPCMFSLCRIRPHCVTAQCAVFLRCSTSLFMSLYLCGKGFCSSRCRCEGRCGTPETPNAVG